MPNSSKQKTKTLKNKKGKQEKKQMTLRKQFNLLSEFLGNDFSDSSSSSKSRSKSRSRSRSRSRSKSNDKDEMMKCSKCQEMEYDGPYKEFTSFEIIHILIKSLKDIDIPEVDEGLMGGIISAKTAKRALLFSSVPGLKKYIVLVSSVCKVLDELRTGHKDKIMESIKVIVNGLEKILKEVLIKQIEIDSHLIDFTGENAKHIKELKLKTSKELQIKINEFNELLDQKIIRYFNEACS
jgi:hypothetical protein